MFKDAQIQRILLVLLFCFPSCGGSGGSSDSTTAQNFKTEVIVSDAQFPVSIVQSADGKIFYTELATGNVRVIVNEILQPQPVTTIGVLGSGNEGLLGIALDPDFAQNALLYTFYTAPNPTRNLVARFKIVNNLASDPLILIDNLPSGGHDGGRLVFSKDGTLFISVGDAGTPQLAQSKNSYAGKILRLNRDGSIPSDNPDPASAIFASGLRNAFGLSIDPRNGTLYASDNGPTCDDELNRVLPGSNLGWRANQPCADNDLNFIQPIIRFNPPIAPTGIAFYSGGQFQGLKNDLLVADYLRGYLTRYSIDESSGEIIDSEILVNGELGPLIDSAVGSDGYIYLASTTAIARLVPN